MTQEQKRIKLAEAAGWRLFSQFKNLWAPPKHVVEYDCDAYPLPDYFSDLNAVHELEKVLDPLGKDGAYEYWLRTVCHIPERESTKGRYYYRATATQRCEALGKTLNLW
jgi:hypothetical protein